MIIGSFDTDQAVLVVAEIGNNHEGSYALAEEMIGRAAQAGAGAVKFQTFKPELYQSSADPKRLAKLKSFELSPAEFKKLSQAAEKAGLIFLSTPFDLQSAEVLRPLVPAFKIASGDNNFYPLLEKIAGFGRPIILSSGLAGLTQLTYAKALIERVWAEKGFSSE
ncbi:MAG: N-acetylneuraminate synthase family protein, partial [Deltaproteobacteria bacterium]|nr:N-acetylneuraminate synthase family protein [Deltaproteobacteria bacterium]